MTLRRFLLLAVLSTAPAAAPLVAQEEIPYNWEMPYTNGIAAVVNDRIITVEQVREYMAPLVPEVRRRSRTQSQFNEQIAQLARESLQNLIDRIIVIQEFRDMQYQIPENYIENEYDDFITKEFGGDRAQFLEYLKLRGKTPRDFRDELEEKVIVDFMRGRLRQNTSQVSPERIQEYYQEHKEDFMQEEAIRLRQIVLAPYASESEAVMEQQARKIIDQVRSGEAKFADLAKKHSQDSRAERGGDWGWIKRGDLADTLSEPAFKLREGEVSEPVTMNERIFLLYVEDRREEGVRPLAEVRPEIEEAITAQLARQAQDRWLERLRKKAFIRYYLAELR